METVTILRQVLTNSMTGPLATAVAMALAAALGLAANNWQASRVRYEARIAELSRASERAQATLQAQLASCHAANDARRPIDSTYAAASPARRLLEQRPQGIDACARMESADRAVLSNLKK